MKWWFRDVSGFGSLRVQAIVSVPSILSITLVSEGGKPPRREHAVAAGAALGGFRPLQKMILGKTKETALRFSQHANVIVKTILTGAEGVGGRRRTNPLSRGPAAPWLHRGR